MTMAPVHTLPLFSHADGNTDAAMRDLPQLPAPPIYSPVGVGFKAEGPSRQAAEALAPRIGGLRLRVLQALAKAQERRGPAFDGMAADELALAMGEHPLSIRPRFSDLMHLGLIEKTDAAGTTTMGCSASRWRVSQAGFLALRMPVGVFA